MRRKLLIVVSVVLAAAGGAIGAGSLASAATGPATASDLVTPAIKMTDGRAFYTADQIKSVWAAVTEHYPSALPPGVTFPADLPAVFTPDPGATPYYDPQFVDEIANQDWECAWLGYATSAQASGKTDVIAQAQKSLGTAQEIPTSDSKAALASAVKLVGSAFHISDPIQARFRTECGTW